jgi:predicted MPP superfamily phosphohydrolase
MIIVFQQVVPLQALSVDNDKYYSILIDHQPRRMDAAAEAGYDMYLAGHTHTGQMFPNRLVTQRMYKLDYGLARFGDLTAVVSNGYGFWGPPVRTELKPEISTTGHGQ